MAYKKILRKARSIIFPDEDTKPTPVDERLLANVIQDSLILCNFCAAVFRKTDPVHSEFLSCPVCGAIARERVAYQCILDEIQRRTGEMAIFIRESPLFKSLRLLELSPRYNPIRHQIYLDTLGEYLASDFDLSCHRADIQLDLTNPDDIAKYQDHFDVVICSHVLEHIPDYEQAMQNLYHLTAPGGFLILQVPLLERQYVKVTGDEFHGDNTRVYHRFGFDLQIELNQIFHSSKSVVGLLDFPITSPEIDLEKYTWLKGHRGDCIIFGESKMKYFGLGMPDLCDAFLAYRGS